MAKSSNNVVVINNEESDDLTLVDVLDHILNTGVILRGNLVISLAGVDLLYVGLDVILTSVETAMRHMQVASGVRALPAARSRRQTG
jgi:hypothetical protein